MVKQSKTFLLVQIKSYEYLRKGESTYLLIVVCQTFRPVTCLIAKKSCFNASDWSQIQNGRLVNR